MKRLVWASACENGLGYAWVDGWMLEVTHYHSRTNGHMRGTALPPINSTQYNTLVVKLYYPVSLVVELVGSSNSFMGHADVILISHRIPYY